MSPKNIHLNWDKDNDTLSVFRSATGPYATTNVDVNADVVVRIDQKTKEVVGLLIDDFSRVFHDWTDLSDWELMEKFKVFPIEIHIFYAIGFQTAF